MAGYYSGYYTNAKRPRGPEQIIEKMERRALQSEAPEIDMDAEIARIRALDEQFSQQLGGLKNV